MSADHAEPTPVADDAQATTTQLHNHAATDYAQAQTLRDALSNEDRIHPYDTQ